MMSVSVNTLSESHMYIDVVGVEYVLLHCACKQTKIEDSGTNVAECARSIASH